MPVYDYKCNKCNIIIELYVHSNLHDQYCKNCHEKLVKVFSSTKNKPIFLGTGFYESDYKRKK